MRFSRIFFLTEHLSVKTGRTPRWHEQHDTHLRRRNSFLLCLNLFQACFKAHVMLLVLSLRCAAWISYWGKHPLFAHLSASIVKIFNVLLKVHAPETSFLSLIRAGQGCYLHISFVYSFQTLGKCVCSAVTI